MAKEKNPESSITQEIIDKVHIMLSNFKTGEDIIEFIRTTEPIFMKEVSRFVQTEVSRFRFDLPPSQSLYLGSIIAAAYLSGFLIAREAQHRLFNGKMCFSSPIRESIKPKEFDELVDKYSKNGLSYREIGNMISKTLDIKIPKGNNNKNRKRSKNFGKRLDIRDLD